MSKDAITYEDVLRTIEELKNAPIAPVSWGCVFCGTWWQGGETLNEGKGCSMCDWNAYDKGS